MARCVYCPRIPDYYYILEDYLFKTRTVGYCKNHDHIVYEDDEFQNHTEITANEYLVLSIIES